MRIYSMTATFGKLEHEKLELEPGMNIIEAPNEWGKSTWCAFLTAMFYGLDTRAKSTRSALAEKEHYAPWSGSPMAGRVDLNWNGRDITIERFTRGRIPMGHFRAYETASGLEIPELDGGNCGKTLLGVEKSVFLRSGFLRLKDLPVTEDEALRRRLNALVSTGDESGRGEKLAGELKELQNRIRYNRTGLLPQAQANRDAMEETMEELSRLREQYQQTRLQLDSLHDWQLALENHRVAMDYAAAREDARKVEQAQSARDASAEKLAELEARCAGYPGRETAEEVLAEIFRLRRERNLTELSLLELTEPEPPAPMAEFAGCSGSQAIRQATADRNEHWALSEKKNWLLVLGLMMLAGGVLAYWYLLPGLILGGAGLALSVLALILGSKRRRRIRTLEAHYGSSIPEHWLRAADSYASQQELYRRRLEAYTSEKEQLQQKLEQLRANIDAATEGRGLEVCAEEWQGVLSAWETLDAARKEAGQAREHWEALRSMAKTAPAPEFPDRLDCDREETQSLLRECAAQRQQVQLSLGQLQGRMDAIGDPLELEKRLAAENARIESLEQHYAALTLARETLAQAAEQLQRRFAPRISGRARDLMEKLTGGRYHRLRLEKDLLLQAGAEGEDTLRETLWRSDGTADQLYLALRLAVAEELTPEAPLILDDALVRFDDTRLRAALEILKEISETKQILLFTCQSREKKLLQ